MSGRRPLRTGSGSERTNRAATVKERTETPKADNAGVARLRHPHVLTICDVFHQAETYAYTMEWIDGKSLAQVIEGSVTLSAEHPFAPKGRRTVATGGVLILTHKFCSFLGL